MKIDVVRSFEQFQELAPEWRALHAQSAPHNPFLSYEFFHCLVEVFFAQRELLIVLLRDQGKVRAIAPFVRDGIAVRSISNIHSHYFDFVAAPDDAGVYQPVFNYLREQRCAHIHLGDVSVDSGLYRYLSQSRCFLQAVVYERASPLLKIEQAWEDYYRSISKNFRENYRKRVNKVARSGGHVHRVCRERGEIEQFLQDMFDIEKASWKHPLGRSMFSNEQQPQFYRLLLERFFDHVRLEIVDIDGRPSAFWLSLVYGDTLFQLKNSFVEELKDFSPGVILTLESLQACFEQQLACVDYLGVSNSVKSKVSNDSLMAFDLKLYPKTLKNRLYFLLKYTLWPKVGDNPTAQRLKNFLLRSKPKQKVNRKTYLKQ